jgi:F0F1-type ATP synthase assembly protein I
LTGPTRRAKSAHANRFREARIDKKMIQVMSTYSYIGIFFGVAVCIGLFAGHWADRRFHTEPWLTLAGVLIGLAAGGRELYRLSKKALKEEER